MFNELYDSDEETLSNVEDDINLKEISEDVHEKNVDILTSNTEYNNSDSGIYIFDKEGKWIEEPRSFKFFVKIYFSVCNLPEIDGEDISFVREIPKKFIDAVNIFSDVEIGDAIKKLDFLSEDIVENYPARVTTMKEFLLYYIVRASIRFERKQDYTKLDEILLHTEKPVRLTALLGITYTNNEINVGRKFPFLKMSNISRYKSCSFMMKYIGRNNLLNINFPEYNSTKKTLIPYDITKMSKDKNGIIYYSHKKFDQGTKKFSSETMKIINHNRIMAILSYLKFNTFGIVFKLNE